MQTFLPYPKFSESAAVLDYRRLGKQRVETLQIMKALLTGKGWVNHPVTKMWTGYEWALLHYQKACVDAWLELGFKDTCMAKTFDLYFSHVKEERNVVPPWLGNRAFHYAQKSNLVRKDPDHYGPIFGDVPDDIPYIYPVL